MAKLSLRPLHFVLKVANLSRTIEFYRDSHAMKVLRFEVFSKGCDAACNGPYDGKWSKTMIGYGNEDENFVLELTYNYDVKSYDQGNLLKHLKLDVKRDICSEPSLAKLDPDGYPIIVGQSDENCLSEVCLRCADINESVTYWSKLLHMECSNSSQTVNQSEDERVFTFHKPKFALRLYSDSQPICRGTNYGRIAFSCPSDQLPVIQKEIQDANYNVLTPLVSLDTPGKATVQVVILEDPSGHEICIVGDEGFRELSKVDLDANEALDKSISEDKSEAWFAKKAMLKKEMAKNQ